MLHVTNLRLPIDADQTTLYKKLAKHLGASVKDLSQVVLTRQSIDARKSRTCTTSARYGYRWPTSRRC